MTKTALFLSMIGVALASGCAVEAGDSAAPAGDALSAPRAEVVTEARADDPLGVHALAGLVGDSAAPAATPNAAVTGFTEN